MVEYEAQELWYGQAFLGTKGGDLRECEQITEDLLLQIKRRLKGHKYSPYRSAREEFSDVHYLKLHPFTFEKKLSSSRVSLDCRIRINRCSPNEHYATKIWVIIGANSKQDSQGLQEIFKSIEQEAEVIRKIIEKNIRSQTSVLSSNQEKIVSYPIKVRNIGNSRICSEDGIFRLFETDEEKEAVELLKRSEIRDVVRDLLILHGKDVSQELSTERLKAMGILWRLMKNYSHLGETNFIYGCDFQDNYAQITGFSNVGQSKDLHTLFRPKILQIVYGL